MTNSLSSIPSGNRFDIVIVGAGFAGLYALHKALKEGYSAIVLEDLDDAGGVWYANRYPGARCDTESFQYSYSFSEELEQEWVWKEKFASQQEIHAYIKHVVDKFGLAPHLRFNSRVERAEFVESANRWLVSARDGQQYSAEFLLMATGCLSAPLDPVIPGIENFKGRIIRTSDWPKEGYSAAGQSVALVGTGSSGVQVAPYLGREAKQFYVVQRTASYSIPLRNQRVDETDETIRQRKANYRQVREAALKTPTYTVLGPPSMPGKLVPRADREKEFERRWQAGGGLTFMDAYSDMRTDPEVNEHAGEFIRRKIAEVVKNPETARKLTPEIKLGSKRICADTGYYEMFNLPHVDVVDLRSEQLVGMGANSLITSTRELQIDTLVLAVGFDALTGALSRIDIRGRGGKTLAAKWAQGPLNYLGIAISDFPNLFMVTGPGNPTIHTNCIISAEKYVDWIMKLVAHLKQNNLTLAEADKEAEKRWFDYVGEVGASSLLLTANAYAVGANVPGKPRMLLSFTGGAPQYEHICEVVAANNYRGFTLQ